LQWGKIIAKIILLQWEKIIAKIYKSWQVLAFFIMSLLLPTVAENKVAKAYGNAF
jgi:hypothetical protein